jgi:glycosyltransferase involved in cell wall biosynthesis
VLQVANPLAPPALRRALRAFRPDVVHVRMFLTQLSPLILPALRDVTSLFHAVNYQSICPLNTKLLPDGTPCHQLAGPACRRAGCVSVAGLGRVLAQQALWRRWRGVFDEVVANSEWTARRLRADGVRVDRVIWNGVPARPPGAPPSARPTVLFAGRLVEKKGVLVLLRALRLVRERVPAVLLRIAGDGPDRPRVEAAISELGLRDCVELTGHLGRDELERAAAGAWVQAVPSTWEEPFGLVAAEAMMRGTAVVASGSGGLTEVVRHGETGLLVAPGESAALADAIAELCADRERALSMGAAGRAFALAELTDDRLVDRFEAVYAELTRPRVPSAATR